MKKEKFNLIMAIVLFFISAIFLYLEFWVLCLITLSVSFFFCVEYALRNIDILNEECNPEKFYELNKNKKSQVLNCCFALLHGYSDDKKEIFVQKLEDARGRKLKGNLYKMKLDYLQLNFKILTDTVENGDIEEFNLNWTENKFLPLKDSHSINNFLQPSTHYGCMLDSVREHWQRALNYYETQMYSMSVAEFQYVVTYGGTTIYSKASQKYIEELKDYKPERIIPKDKIKKINRYKLNRSLVDFYFCMYIIIFIFFILIGGIL